MRIVWLLKQLIGVDMAAHNHVFANFPVVKGLNAATDVI